MLKKLLLAVAAYFYFVLAAQARVYYLPDYQMSFGNRSSQSDTNTSTSTHKPTCSAYGYYTANSRPSNAECSKVSIPGLTCYSCTVCASSFSYNSSNCSGEYVLSGNSCGGNYNKCICDPTKYITTEDGGGCKEGETADTSKSCINKTDGKTLYQCVKDPCYGLADNETELGCDKYYDQCPSKCELGSTCKPTDCSAYTLTSCPSGSTCESCTPGCGDNAPRYKAKEYKGLAFQVDSPTNGKITFTITGSNYQIDWGDGTIDTNNTHTYATAGLYDIEIFGDVTTFLINSSPSAEPKRLYSLNLPKAKKMDFSAACLSIGIMNFKSLVGTIPPLPDSLTDGSGMFAGCWELSGSIPKLPSGLTNGVGMFSHCKGLTGNIPELPSSLIDGSSMFWNCENLTGNVPSLPDSLTVGSHMFSDCSKLTGNIPPLPKGLTEGYSMFGACGGLSGKAPAKPSNLNLNYYTNIFNGTQVTNDGSWLDDAW